MVRASTTNRRLTALALLFVLAGTFLLVRLVKIQLVDHSRLAQKALAHHYRRVVLPADRGRIVDRQGWLLAFSADNLSIYAMREEVTDMDRACEVLGSLDIDPRWARRRLTGERGFVWISRGLHSDRRVRELIEPVPGLYVRREAKRVHPRGSLAHHVVGNWHDDATLLSGIERRCDELLSGEVGWETVAMDAVGTSYSTPRRRAPRPGRDMVLGIDARIEEIAELALAGCLSRWHAAGGSIVIVDPRNGDVLAMASQEGVDSGTLSRNRAITDAVEVGSCAKIVAAAAALEAGLCDTTTKFFCGVLPDEEKPPVVRDDHGDEDWLSFLMVLAQSRNVGTARIARLVGEEAMFEWLDQFGFGSPSGIDLPGETPGLLRPLCEWSGRSLETVAIGYEFAITPLQLCMAYAAVANGGLLLRPRLILECRNPTTGACRTHDVEPVRRVMSERTAALLRSVLHRATEPGGTGEKAALAWTHVAGKTGTARKFDPELGRYNHKRHVASFVGFGPSEDPRYVIAVVIDEPQGGYYGGEVAAPVFKEVIEKIAALDPASLRLDLRQVQAASPPRPAGSRDAMAAPPRGSQVPDFRGYATLSARLHARRLGLSTEVLGTGSRITHQVPAPAQAGDGTLILYTGEETPASVHVPDLAGMSLRQAMATLGATGLNLERNGHGVIVKQRPAPGAPVDHGAIVSVVLRDLPRSWVGGETR